MKKYRTIKYWLILLIILLVISGLFTIYSSSLSRPAKTEETNNSNFALQQKPGEDSSPGNFSLIMKLLGFFLFFVVFIFSYVKFNKHFMNSKGKNFGLANIQIVGSKMIAPKKSIYVVDVLEHVLVLGITDSQISVLLNIPNEKVSSEIKKSWQANQNLSEPIFKKITKELLHK